MDRSSRARCRLLVATVIGWHFACVAGTVQASAGALTANAVMPSRAARILIQPKPGAGLAALGRMHSQHQCKLLGAFPRINNLQILEVPAGETVDGLIAQYQRSGLVEFAEPDYALHATTVPNDPYYTSGQLWGLNNYGQSGGTPHADIHATNAWDVLNSASNIVVAVVDSGIRSTHEDLAPNMWANPEDGSHGWNALTATNNPNDDNGHGTMMAGVVGAVGNNGKGVTGVAWQVQLMACKCLDSLGAGSNSDFITCIDYARTHGAKIINASLAGTNFSLAVSNAIVSAREAGIILVAAAGNSVPPNFGINGDVTPIYPGAYHIANIVSVAYTTRTDALGPYSDYGATNVALAAPGDQIYSTTYNSDISYLSDFSVSLGKGTGTSFATAYVSGACALLMAQYPADSYQDIIRRLLEATDPLPALAGKCRTGGRLNLYKALRTIRVASVPPTNGAPFQLRVSGGLSRTCTVEASTNLASWSPVFTNTTSTNGTFDFVDGSAAQSSRRFFRATAAP